MKIANANYHFEISPRVMKNNIKLHFRKSPQGPEAELVKKFLELKSIFIGENLEYEVFTEAYAEAGIPDILIVAWDKHFSTNWCLERNKLVRDDIKILHHISTFKKLGIHKSKIFQQLGYTNIVIDKSLVKLDKAGLINEVDGRICVNEIKEKFFIRKIITIEAKIKNWQHALKQAQLNENFSSHSYVLLPSERINKNILSCFDGRIGLLSQDSAKVVFKKKAAGATLPRSSFSWMLNEFIGRQYFSSNL